MTPYKQVTGWELKTEGEILKLHRAWKVKNFVKGLEFFQLVADIAEEEGILSFALLSIFTLSQWLIFFFFFKNVRMESL
jgi:hypothetical protein